MVMFVITFSYKGMIHPLYAHSPLYESIPNAMQVPDPWMDYYVKEVYSL